MEQFEALRPLLFTIAYQMLGSAMEAEDIVQEAYLRYQSVDPETIRSHRAFLTTIVTRLCINSLQSARAKRETYIGPWLPEPVLTGDGIAPSPIKQITDYESISVAFLILLESLTPVERAVFLLREVFEYDYAEIALLVDKQEATCRQLFSRAKKHIVDRRPRFAPSPDEHQHLLKEFMQAVGDGDLNGLMALLANDASMWADGGGKTQGAATRPLFGAEAVAQFVMASTRFLADDFSAGDVTIEEVNGEQAIILKTGKDTFIVILLKVEAGKIKEIWTIGNPDKLQYMQKHRPS